MPRAGTFIEAEAPRVASRVHHGVAVESAFSSRPGSMPTVGPPAPYSARVTSAPTDSFASPLAVRVGCWPERLNVSELILVSWPSAYDRPAVPVAPALTSAVSLAVVDADPWTGNCSSGTTTTGQPPMNPTN